MNENMMTGEQNDKNDCRISSEKLPTKKWINKLKSVREIFIKYIQRVYGKALMKRYSSSNNKSKLKITCQNPFANPCAKISNNWKTRKCTNIYIASLQIAPLLFIRFLSLKNKAGIFTCIWWLWVRAGLVVSHGAQHQTHQPHPTRKCMTNTPTAHDQHRDRSPDTDLQPLTLAAAMNLLLHITFQKSKCSLKEAKRTRVLTSWRSMCTAF